jgi:Lon protease-like protein
MSATVVTFDDLPATLPVFPLSGVLLLPRGSLPLNIFEPRYRNMTADAMASDRLIGMVQPMAPEEIPVTPTGEIKNLDRERLPLYSIGCAGRIAAFEETPDGRYLLSLAGVCRFSMRSEIETTRGYRRFEVDWSDYRNDFETEGGRPVERVKLLAAMRRFFDAREIRADWTAIEAADDERLITALAMSSPFGPAEKQALLEAADLAARCDVLTAIADMAALDPNSDGTRPQ